MTGEPERARAVLRLDRTNERLWRGAEAVPLTPKGFAVLRYLMDHGGRLVTKAELLEAVWPDTHVTDAVLKVYVGEIRKALGDRAADPRFIETRPAVATVSSAAWRAAPNRCRRSGRATRTRWWGGTPLSADCELRSSGRRPGCARSSS